MIQTAKHVVAAATATTLAAALALTGGGAALALTGGGAAMAAPPTTDTDTDTAITIRPRLMQVGQGQSAEPIPPSIIGANHRWLRSGMGMWDAEADAPAPGAVAAAEGAHLEMVRYPGGTVANMFDFTRAIGPADERECQTGAGFVGGRFSTADSSYGPDEQERFVDAIGGRTMIMVPMINQSATDAANYVEYMNAEVGTNPNGGIAWAERRAANGHPEPYDIRTWEVGNEPYFPNQRYWRATDPETKLAQFINGGAQRQTADSPRYQHNDGLFAGCNLADPVTSTGEPGQQYRTRYDPIALPADATEETGPIAAPVLRVDGEQWRLVDSLDEQPAGARVYTVDGPEGTVTFGDGEHGAVPPEGATFSIEYTTVQDGFLDYYDAIKSVDPTVDVCSGWGRPAFVEAMGDRPYDCIGFHMYTSPRAGGPDDPVYDTEQLYQHLIPLGAVAVGKLAALREAVESARPDPTSRPPVIVTEWGTLRKKGPTGARMPAGYGAMLMTMLYRGELAIGMVEHGVQLATMSNLNGGPRKPGKPSSPESVIGGAPNFFVTDQSLVMNLVHPMIGSQALQSTVTRNPTGTGGDYPALRVLATRGTDGTVRVLVLNRDLSGDHTARVRLPRRLADGTVRATTLDAATVDAFNTWDDQDEITRVVTTGPVDGREVTRTFPAHSLTLLEFPA